MRYIVTEYTHICRSEASLNAPLEASLGQTYVPARVFDQLKKLAFQPDTDPVVTLRSVRGKEVIQVKNYVGILQLSEGVSVEILPKIAQRTDFTAARRCLLKMLRSARQWPFRHLTQAHLGAASLPLWEVFVRAFVEEMEQLTRQGIQKSYQTLEGKQNFLRGKWLLQQQRPWQAETFAVAYDDFLADVLPNRLLKWCVLSLLRRSTGIGNQLRLRRLRFAWEEVSSTDCRLSDFDQIDLADRRFARYQKPLEWAKILLTSQGWIGQGDTPQRSLLFPTERLFEQHVAHQFKKYWPDGEVICQDSTNYLIADHAGQQRFNLRPDLVVKTASKTLILDTKWKWIDPALPHYGIASQDLYQLYAYGQKYQADALYLLYPAHEDFMIPFPPFRYDDALTLTVLPFDLQKNSATLMAEIREWMQV